VVADGPNVQRAAAGERRGDTVTRNIPDWARDVAMRLGVPSRQRTTGDTFLLRELTLEHIGRCPVSAMGLFERVRADFGECGERRLWRALLWQVARGAVVVVDPQIGSHGHRYMSGGYVRARRSP
jgi:hypothetical protein